MSDYKYSQRSLNNLDTTISDLRKVAKKALSVSAVDIIITEGSRSISRQKTLFMDEKSKVNPDAYSSETILLEKGKHLVNAKNPLSRAFDFCIYIKGRPDLSYDKYHLMYVSGVIDSVAREMFKNGEISYPIRLGSNWDGDGILKYDQKFFDAPHVQSLAPVNV